MIIYFTGTGNSRMCAEKLSVFLDDEVQDAFPRLRSKSISSCHSDRPWVFVCPTYAWRIPRIFEDYLRRTTFTGSRNAYFVMTCGSDIGSAGSFLQRLCSDLKLNFMGVLPVVMPENYVAMFSVPDQKQVDKILAASEAPLEKAAQTILAGEEFAPVRTGPISAAKSGVVNRMFYYHSVTDSKFRVTEACIGCGKCAALCPQVNILMDARKPTRSGTCTHCMACIGACPEHAIEYGTASVGKNRYYNGVSSK